MKVSIITIVYNNQACIGDCIRSVQSQKYPDIEHIIIDGGSTDGTQKVIHSFKKKPACFISEKDGGLYEALNKGIHKATGDVIGILHSDDVFFDKNTVGQIVIAFKESNADLVYANGQYVDREDISTMKRIYRSKPFKKIYLKFGWIPLHTTIFAKSELFQLYGHYDTQYQIASDYEISLRWFSNSSIKPHYLDAWVVKMRLGGKSTTPSLQQQKSTEDFHIIRKFKLLGLFTLGCKVVRKIPQYLIPHLIKLR